MRLGVSITVAAICCALAGCNSLNPKSWQWPSFGQKKAKNDREPAVPYDDVPPPVAPALANAQPGGPYNGVLAGQVIDAFNQKRPGAQIQVTPLDAAPNESALEAAANDYGYFTIQGLQPGRRYQLMARAKRGDQQLAGTTLATPPNAVLLIRVSDDLAGSPRGDAKPPRRGAEKDNATPPSATPYRNDGSQGWSPNGAPNYGRASERGTASLLAPTPIDQPARDGARNRRDIYIKPPGRNEDGQDQPVEGRPPLRPQYQTYGDNLAQSNADALMSIPGPVPFPHRSTIGSPIAAPQPDPHFIQSPAQSRVPSCLVRGNRLESLALYDLQRQPFELNQVRGKLILLDFWGSWCTPCVQGVPQLSDLQRRYGPYGLEVIGIAYEEGTPEERAERVNFVRNRQGANYRMLLGEGEDCPVRTNLGVKNFPTLILIDDQGRIVWRGEGLSPQNKSRLEEEIRRRLPAR